MLGVLLIPIYAAQLVFAIVVAIPKIMWGDTEGLSARQRKELYENVPTFPKNPSLRTRRKINGF